MVISGTLAVAGALIASFSGALIAGSNLFSGWRQRKFMEKESAIGRQHAERMQQLQMQFQDALQRRNLQASERLQHEMARVQYENARALQRENFANQEAAWEANKFYENAWPFRMTPKGYVSQLEVTYRFERVPLQILVPNALTDQLQGFGELIKRYYSLQSKTPVYYYDGGWKDGRTINGGALLGSLYEVLKGLPTLVLLPQGSFRDSFSLEVGYWGLGQMDDVPKRIGIISALDMSKLELKLLRAQADRLIDDYGSDTSHDDNNMEVRRRERVREQKLKAAGADPETIDRMLQNEFVKPHGTAKVYKTGGRDVEDSKREVVKQICDVVCAAYSDVYHLLETQTPPQAPLLAESNPMFADVGVRRVLYELYRGILDDCKESDEACLLQYPLYCALIAESLHRAGWLEESRPFEEAAEKALRYLYPVQTAQIAKSHLNAIRILRELGAATAAWPLSLDVRDADGGDEPAPPVVADGRQAVPAKVGYVGKFSGGVIRRRF